VRAFGGAARGCSALINISMATQQFESWHLADQFVTAKGAKTCLLTVEGKPFTFQPSERVTCPFGISSWEEDSARKNLELRCTPELEEFFGGLDAWAVAYIAQHSNRLLKKQLSVETIRENYKPTLNKKADYPALLRTKINASGPKALRFWDEQGKATEEPQDWRSVECTVQLHVKNLWIMGNSFGFTIECSDLQVHEPTHACPFGALAAACPLKEINDEEARAKNRCIVAS